MDNYFNLEEMAERLKPARELYARLGFQEKQKLFGATASSDMDNILALAVLMRDSKVLPIDYNELAKRIEVGVAPEIDLEILTEAVAARIKVPNAAPEVDYNKLAEMVAEKLEGRLGQSSGNVPYIQVLFEDWSIDHPDDIPGDVKIISEYLMSKGWKPESCVIADEKILFDGKLKITQEEIVHNYESEESFVLYYKKNGSMLKIDVFPADEEIKFYLTNYFPDFKQGVDNLQEDVHLAPKTKKRLAKILTGLEEKFLGDDFDPEEDGTEADQIEIIEMADRLGPKEEE